MANGGYWESEAAWRRVEAPLIEVDDVIAQFASIHSLSIARNLKDWPDRDLEFATALGR